MTSKKTKAFPRQSVNACWSEIQKEKKQQDIKEVIIGITTSI
jgi:hypothetical protein